MKNAILILGALLLSTPALAYKDGTYSCKNMPGLPDNTYKVRTVQLDGGLKLPYVEIELNRREKPGDASSAIVQSRLEGFATAISSSAGADMLMIAAIQLEFDGDRLLGCRQ